MTRILLACGIGASTGFMAANMRKAAKAQGLDVSIHAVSKSQVPEYADKIDELAKRAILPSDATREARSPAR